MSMSEEKVAVGRKLVWPRKPYIYTADISESIVGREKEMGMIAAAWMPTPWSRALSPLLVGPPGCGKNTMVYEMAKRMDVDLYVCQGYENITAEELACSLLPSDEGNGKIDFMISSLATAMLKGGICFIDEIGKFPGKALSLLASVLDDRRYLDLDLLGERIHAHPQFRFIAATNSEDLDGLPDFIRSRLFPCIAVDKPEKDMINTIIVHQYPEQQKVMKQLLNSFWGLWDEVAKDWDEPSPRDIIQIFSLAEKLARFGEQTTSAVKDKKTSPGLQLPTEIGRENAAIRMDHIQQALHQFQVMKEQMPC